MAISGSVMSRLALLAALFAFVAASAGVGAFQLPFGRGAVGGVPAEVPDCRTTKTVADCKVVLKCVACPKAPTHWLNCTKTTACTFDKTTSAGEKKDSKWPAHLSPGGLDFHLVSSRTEERTYAWPWPHPKPLTPEEKNVIYLVSGLIYGFFGEGTKGSTEDLRACAEVRAVEIRQ